MLRHDRCNGGISGFLQTESHDRDAPMFFVREVRCPKSRRESFGSGVYAAQLFVRGSRVLDAISNAAVKFRKCMSFGVLANATI
jgi:hypothetical protein